MERISVLKISFLHYFSCKVFLFILICLPLINAKNAYINPCFWIPNRLQADMEYIKDGPTSYVKHQSGMEKFQPKDYIPGLCSHIIYSSAEINGVFEAMLYPDQVLKISELNELKTNDPDLKIVLSFGSTSILDQLRFKKLASDSGLLKVFVSTMKKLVEKNPIDGLFFEWIYPHDKNDRTNYIILLRQLQETLVNSTSDEFSIGIMLPKEVEFIRNGYYISDLSKIVDYVITSPYDISYDSESVSQADKDKNVLFKETHDINTRKFSSMESTSHYLIEAGMDRSKIIIGVSITAIGWNVPKSANSTIQKAVSQFSSSEHRETIYFEICNLLAEGAGPHYDVENNVAYLEYGNEWLIYENKRTIQAKADWVKANHLGGIAIMGIHLDDFAGSCKAGQGKKFPIVSSLADQLSNSAINYENFQTSHGTAIKPSGSDKLVLMNGTGQILGENFSMLIVILVISFVKFYF